MYVARILAKTVKRYFKHVEEQVIRLQAKSLEQFTVLLKLKSTFKRITRLAAFSVFKNRQTLDLLAPKIRSGSSFYFRAIYFWNFKTISKLNFKWRLVTGLCSNDFSEISNQKFLIYISIFIFSELASGRNPPDPAIWLVPRPGSFLRSCPLTRAKSLAGSFTSLFVVCEKPVILNHFSFKTCAIISVS